MYDKLYILVIRNGLTQDISNSIAKTIEWIEKFTPFKVEIEYYDINEPISYKPFMALKGRMWYGLSDAKEMIRKTNRAINEYYDQVWLCYQSDRDDTAYWTYPGLLNGAAFIEIPISPLQNFKDFEVAAMTHELIHGFYRCLWANGKAIQDDMDLYDKDAEPYAIDGNRARNLRRIAPYWPVIADPPKRRLLGFLMAKLGVLKDELAKLVNKKELVITKFATAIKEYEGYSAPCPKYPKGTRSWRNNNPGNVKIATQYEKQNFSIGNDPGGFDIFKTYDAGFDFLKRMIRNAIDGKSQVYFPNDTILSFIEKYAPSGDGNVPTAYALYISQKLGVGPQTKLKDLIL